MRKVFAVVICLVPALVFAESTMVSSSDMKEKWPLSVESGMLRCEPLPAMPKAQLVTFTSNGKIYAVNGTASGHAKKNGWRQIDEIWKDNPEISGLKINIGPLIDRGLALCR